jgi:hypothetical protein
MATTTASHKWAARCGAVMRVRCHSHQERSVRCVRGSIPLCSVLLAISVMPWCHSPSARHRGAALHASVLARERGASDHRLRLPGDEEAQLSSLFQPHILIGSGVDIKWDQAEP